MPGAEAGDDPPAPPVVDPGVDAFAASQTFEPGCLVLTEEAALVFPLTPEPTTLFYFLDSVADTAGIARAALYCLVPLAQCPAAAIQELEAQFPIPQVPLDHVLCRRFLAVGNRLVDSALLPPGSDPARYCDMLLRVRLWARHITLPDGTPALGLYPRSVKIQHSCYPNLLHFADGTTILYRALRPIAVGDLLTISYIEDVELWKGTPQRQAYILQTRFYRCNCARCQGPDATRAMPCKACGMDTVLHHPQLGRWKCATPYCAREYGDPEMPLSAEALLIEYTHTLFTKDTDMSVDYLATLRHIHLTLGRRHWCPILLTYLILAKFWNAPAEQQPRALTKRLVVGLAESLADWFMEVMGDSVPTARMCHFAAGILAAYGGLEKEFKYKEYDASAQRLFAIIQS